MSKPLVVRHIPNAFDPARGADVAARVEGVQADQRDLIAGAAGCSPYLAGLIEKENAWLTEALSAPDTAVAHELSAIADWTASDLPSRLRRAKRRVALMTALADLGGAWSLEDVTETLSDLADTAATTALRAAVAAEMRRGKMPMLTDADVDTAGGMVVLAMGKLGARELNYSSDIDLICLFDETRFDPDDFYDVRAGFVRATRKMCASLSEITGDGYVFRTDLRLRPDPAVTPVCMAMEAAERYYESLGRTWERAAYIKARPIAGALEAGQRFLAALTPFVWRKHLDFAAIQDAHDMRLAIREHKGLGGPITLPGHNMKLGRGGIREIEFFTQTRQLIAGGRDPDLRVRGTKQGLAVLARKGWVPDALSDALSDHYTWHRTVEHRLQMVHDAQTHSLPVNDEGFGRLAGMMRCDVDTLKEDLLRRLADVHQSTEGFFAPAGDVGAKTADFDPEIMARWRSYPALRSERSQEIFARLQPELLRRLSEAGKPDAALLAFDGFLSRLPAGVQVFSLLQSNPSLLDLLVDIVSTSPALAAHLSRNASVLDAVIGGDFFTPWPGQRGLESLLSAQVDAATDYEAQLDAARRWKKEWHFRVGVHLLRGLVTPLEAAGQYSDLARAIVSVVMTVVDTMFSEKHGTPPGRGAAVLGMGSLGAGILNPTSDLDLIVIYDAQGEEASDGKKPLATRLYYARFTQALITALSAPMAEGKLYEVDMRLRPSGNQGPVATSLPAFKDYQRNEAWVWEHLALTRAATFAGPKELVAEIEAYRADLLAEPRERSGVVQEVHKMRNRIRGAKTPESIWDVKIGPGRLQEIELIAQTGILLAGASGGSVSEGLAAAHKCGWIDGETQTILTGSAAFYTEVNMAVRLLTATALHSHDLTTASAGFLARTLKMASREDIEARLSSDYERSARLIDQILQADSSPEEP